MIHIKVRMIKIEEDRTGMWVVRLYLSKGRQLVVDRLESKRSACIAASGIPDKLRDLYT